MTKVYLPFLALAAVLAVPAAAQTMPPVSDADQLAAEMRLIGANATDVNALTRAGELSTRLGDYSGAASLFARADKVDPRNGRVKAGMAAVLLHLERPGEALLFYNQAEGYGYPVARFATERGLAYDLVAQQGRAQRDYRLALAGGAGDDETVRRYALSLGISGQKEAALQQLEPLLRRNDRAAWRARAFVLAMNGDAAAANGIATTMMAPGQASGMTAFFARLPGMGPADRAFAVHFGELRPTPQRLADLRLAPALPQLAAEVVPVARAAPPVQVAAARPDKHKRGRKGEVQVAAVAPPAVPALAPPAYGTATPFSRTQVAALTPRAPVPVAARVLAPTLPRAPLAVASRPTAPVPTGVFAPRKVPAPVPSGSRVLLARSPLPPPPTLGPVAPARTAPPVALAQATPPREPGYVTYERPGSLLLGYVRVPSRAAATPPVAVARDAAPAASVTATAAPPVRTVTQPLPAPLTRVAVAAPIAPAPVTVGTSPVVATVRPVSVAPPLVIANARPVSGTLSPVAPSTLPSVVSVPVATAAPLARPLPGSATNSPSEPVATGPVQLAAATPAAATPPVASTQPAALVPVSTPAGANTGNVETAPTPAPVALASTTPRAWPNPGFSSESLAPTPVTASSASLAASVPPPSSEASALTASTATPEPIVAGEPAGVAVTARPADKVLAQIVSALPVPARELNIPAPPPSAVTKRVAPTPSRQLAAVDVPAPLHSARARVTDAPTARNRDSDSAEDTAPAARTRGHRGSDTAAATRKHDVTATDESEAAPRKGRKATAADDAAPSKGRKHADEVATTTGKNRHATAAKADDDDAPTRGKHGRELADDDAPASKPHATDRKGKKPLAEHESEPQRYWVQVAGGANEASLGKAWSIARAKAPALAGKKGYTTPLRATNRVLAGPFKNDDEARAFVNTLNKQGVHAFQFTSDKGQKVTKLEGD